MITTKSVGIGVEADPRPVRGINWCGQPIKEGEDYWGKIDRQPVAAEPADVPVQRVVRKRRKRMLMSPEAKKAISERMRAYWSGKRSATTEETTN